MRIGNSNGIHVHIGKGVFLDPERKFSEGTGVVSHAHSDHAKLKKNDSLIMTPQTRQLIESNSGKKTGANETEFGKKVPLSDGFELSLHSSGHILGSAQLLLEGSQSVAITSDFKLEDSLTIKGAVPLKAEILAIETTFGLQKFAFPGHEAVYAEMASWAKRELEKNNYLMLAGYSTGKAQDLTAFCNKYLGISPIVYQQVYDNNLVYEKNGVKLGEFIKPTHKLNESQCLIVPPHLVSEHFLHAVSLITGKRVSSAIATGWGGRIWPFDRVFSLSDHADFGGLCEYVRESGAKHIYTYHGFAGEFASYASRRLGVSAKPIGKAGQSALNEFV
ncbi:MAG: hypothetical protein WC602_03005 [archaeon]